MSIDTSSMSIEEVRKIREALDAREQEFVRAELENAARKKQDNMHQIKDLVMSAGLAKEDLNIIAEELFPTLRRGRPKKRK